MPSAARTICEPVAWHLLRALDSFRLKVALQQEFDQGFESKDFPHHVFQFHFIIRAAGSQQGVHPEAPTPPRLQQPALPPPQSAPAPVAAPAPAPPAPAAPPPAAAAAPPPAAPAAKPPAAPAARAVVSPEVLAMPRGKRQSEARKKIDEAAI